MKAILFELLGIALAILCIIFAYVYWDEIKTGVGNFVEYLQEEKEEKGGVAKSDKTTMPHYHHDCKSDDYCDRCGKSEADLVKEGADLYFFYGHNGSCVDENGDGYCDVGDIAAEEG